MSTLNLCHAECFIYHTPPKLLSIPAVTIHVFSNIVENNVDPDQMASSVTKPADLDPQCFQKRINPDSAGEGLL